MYIENCDRLFKYFFNNFVTDTLQYINHNSFSELVGQGCVDPTHIVAVAHIFSFADTLVNYSDS